MGPDDILDDVERAIRAGEVSGAQRVLRGIKRKDVPRNAVTRFANLCRRVGLVDTAIRVLNPLVRPAPRRPRVATADELAEYAASLIRIGAVDEASTLLQTLHHPEALFHRVSVLFSRWNYNEAIPLLERYVATVTDDYARLVGKLNLAAALVYERRHSDLENLRAELDEATARRKLWRLRGNVLEISAQGAILRRDWTGAERLLAEAGRLLEHVTTSDLVFVHKWQAIAAILRAPRDEGAARRLREVRAEAVAEGRWETVRSCDHYRAIATGDEPLFLHVYFGTPFESFRAHFVNDYGWRGPIGPHYDWAPEGAAPRPRAPLLDLRAHEAELGRALKPGQLRHRTLATLSKDFYRELPLAGLHAVLWPDAFYNPASSPNRVQQAVSRVRRWLRARRLPLDIVERHGFYRLRAIESVAIRLPARPAHADRAGHAIEALRAADLVEPFSAREVERSLNLPRWSALRILRDAVDERRAVREGSGRTTRYRLVR